MEEKSPAQQRLEAVFAGEAPDRTPVLGGWIACPEHICALAGDILICHFRCERNLPGSLAANEVFYYLGLADIQRTLRRDDA